jgi:hypothetical protein
MRTVKILSLTNLTLLFVGLLPALSVAQTAGPSDPAVEWKKVEVALGRTGKIQAGGVYKVGMPRTDLHITVDGTVVKAPLALGSWLAFKKMDNQAMVMGDLVLTEDEVGPVMMKLQLCTCTLPDTGMQSSSQAVSMKRWN